MDITAQEDDLIKAITDLGLFKVVDSAGRKDRPTALNLPAAFVFFVLDRQIQGVPRPIFERQFDVLVINKNLRGEKEAAQDTYRLLDQVRDAIIGKKLGGGFIGPYQCISRQIANYDGGTIDYLLTFKSTVYLPVPKEL